MKKFLVLSAILGLAGLGVGIVGRQSDPEPSTTVAAAAPETTTTTPAVEAATSSTVAPKVAAKPTAARVTTTTRPAAGSSSPTTVTTAAPVTATTTTTIVSPTTTTALATAAPTCTATADNPTVVKGSSQTIRISSNMPTTKLKLEMNYPKFDLKPGIGNPRQTYFPTTDASGSVAHTFSVSEWSTAPVKVSIQFYKTTGVVGPLACSTSFMSTES